MWISDFDHFNQYSMSFWPYCCCVQEEKVAVAKAKDFLESNTYSADDPYTTALSAYALSLLRSPYAPLALRRLNHMAITQGTATSVIQFKFHTMKKTYLQKK